jgi:hypothetical protein
MNKSQGTQQSSATTQSIAANWSDPEAWTRAASEMSGVEFLTEIAE